MKKLVIIIAVLGMLVSGCATMQAHPKAEAKSPRPPIGERFVLDNGMVLLVKENHALPVVMVNIIIKAGAVMEPPEKAGLAHLTAGLLTKGAGSMSATDISEAIDFIGGSLGFGGGDDYASGSLTILKKDEDTGFSLLATTLLKPKFDQDEIDRLKKSVKAGIIRGEQDPGTVAEKAFSKAVYGEKHPYGIPTEGTLETLDNISREDIASFYERYYAPNNTIMAVVGDITADEAKALIAKHLSTWQKKEVAEPTFPPLPAPKGVETIKIDRDITQANILMGHAGVRREDPDYYKLYVMNYILGGGGFVSRLLDKIRDDMGLAYDVHSYFYPSKYGGGFQVGMSTKNASAKQAVDEALRIMEGMRNQPVTDKELQGAKDYITGSFPMKTDTNAKIAGLLTQVEYYNLGLDYFDMYESEINKVTKEDIQKAAQKYLHPDNLYIVVVAKQKEAGM